MAPAICMLHFMFPSMLVTTVPRSAGFVMSMYSLLRSKPEAPSEEDIEEALAGNLWCADKIVSIFEKSKRQRNCSLQSVRGGKSKRRWPATSGERFSCCLAAAAATDAAASTPLRSQCWTGCCLRILPTHVSGGCTHRAPLSYMTGLLRSHMWL